MMVEFISSSLISGLGCIVFVWVWCMFVYNFKTVNGSQTKLKSFSLLLSSTILLFICTQLFIYFGKCLFTRLNLRWSSYWRYQFVAINRLANEGRWSKVIQPRHGWILLANQSWNLGTKLLHLSKVFRQKHRKALKQ